jgi:hypothetical protein
MDPDMYEDRNRNRYTYRNINRAKVLPYENRQHVSS